MEFAENGRISHRQLYRQIIMAFMAPFLLCLFGKQQTLGLSGICGTVLALLVLFFYVILLIRLRHGFADPCKMVGKTAGRAVGIFFLGYCCLTAAFLLNLLGEIVTVSLGTGISREWLSILALLTCGYGTYRGIQRRGRIAEVSGTLVLAAVVLMLLLSIGQGKWDYFEEMIWSSFLDPKVVFQNGYGVLCAFSGLALLPFALENVEKGGSTGKTVMLAVLTVGILLIFVELLLPSVFGWKRLAYEKIPMIPLLAGADLPGNILARFDVLWMGFLLYSLLFSIGSLVHYGHLIVEKSRLGKGRVWITVLIFLISLFPVKNTGIRDYYKGYLEKVFVPVMLLIEVMIFFIGRKKWKKKTRNMSAFFLLCMVGCLFFLTGCGGVEPEKRTYPLALGADFSEGKFVLTYGIPDLPETTGQEKNEEDQGDTVPVIAGENFSEIEKNYSATQEKYLDPGHLEILVLGRSVLENGMWTEVLKYLKEKPVIGENVYVFQAQDAAKIVGWNSPQKTSMGEYIVGILENNPNGSPKEAVTLRDVYYAWYERGDIPDLPEIEVENSIAGIKF